MAACVYQGAPNPHVPEIMIHVTLLAVELRLPGCRSLKDKRGALRPIIEGIRNRFPVAVAEVGLQDSWKHAQIGVASVSGTPSYCDHILDAVDRFIWSHPQVEVTSAGRFYLDADAEPGDGRHPASEMLLQENRPEVEPTDCTGDAPRCFDESRDAGD